MIEPVNKKVAPESSKIEKARQKLLAQELKQKEMITPQALKEAEEKIRKWLSDHQGVRVSVEKDLALFARNRGAADTSRKVKEIAKGIQESFQIETGSAPSA